MTNIRDRLENWGRYQRGGNRPGGGGMRAKETRSASPYGGQGYKCMTGVICNVLATSATGPAGWRETSGGMRSMTSSEIEDAKAVTSAFIRLPARQQSILRWCYVMNAQPAVICRKMGIRQWPASHFKAELFAAESAIEKLLDTVSRSTTIPFNNLIPSGTTSDAQREGVAVSGGSEKAPC